MPNGKNISVRAIFHADKFLKCEQFLTSEVESVEHLILCKLQIGVFCPQVIVLAHL